MGRLWVEAAVLSVACLMAGCTSPLEAEPKQGPSHDPDTWTLEPASMTIEKRQGTYVFLLNVQGWNAQEGGELWFLLQRHDQNATDRYGEPPGTKTTLYDEWQEVDASAFQYCTATGVSKDCLEVRKALGDQEDQCYSSIWAGDYPCKHDVAMVFLVANGTAHWAGMEVEF